MLKNNRKPPVVWYLGVYKATDYLTHDILPIARNNINYWHALCWLLIISIYDGNGFMRYFIAVFLLASSGQSLALFLPDSFQVSTDSTDVSNDVDC
jgi:hypothetical protein